METLRAFRFASFAMVTTITFPIRSETISPIAIPLIAAGPAGSHARGRVGWLEQARRRAATGSPCRVVEAWRTLLCERTDAFCPLRPLLQHLVCLGLEGVERVPPLPLIY